MPNLGTAVFAPRASRRPDAAEARRRAESRSSEPPACSPATPARPVATISSRCLSEVVVSRRCVVTTARAPPSATLSQNAESPALTTRGCHRRRLRVSFRAGKRDRGFARGDEAAAPVIAGDGGHPVAHRAGPADAGARGSNDAHRVRRRQADPAALADDGDEEEGQGLRLVLRVPEAPRGHVRDRARRRPRRRPRFRDRGARFPPPDPAPSPRRPGGAACSSTTSARASSWSGATSRTSRRSAGAARSRVCARGPSSCAGRR